MKGGRIRMGLVGFDRKGEIYPYVKKGWEWWLEKINGKHEETNYDNYAFIAAYLSEKQANTSDSMKPKRENNDG